MIIQISDRKFFFFWGGGIIIIILFNLSIILEVLRNIRFLEMF